MKKIFIAGIMFLLPLTGQADWNKTQEKQYFDLMFQVTMSHQTYDDFFTVPQVIKHISCIKKFYQQNYTFSTFQKKFYTGDQGDIEEFHIVENICISRILNNSTQKLHI
jgi:hypothetical protein|tara:strand:+ start:86 stop:412 length:327 start_codon:yes stop_codon:yes gene_type:complete